MLVLAIDRPVNFVIAASSTKHTFLKHFLRFARMIPTVRPIDHRKEGQGVIESVRKDVFVGSNSGFTTTVKQGDLIRVHGLPFEFQIVDVLSDTEIRVRTPQELRADKEGPHKNWASQMINKKYDVMAKVCQGNVHEKVTAALESGELVVIFPEGGSHDQTQLLPLKAGACLFLWTAQEKGATCPLICVGANYYGSHKFRSKVVVNIASPINIPVEESRVAQKEYKYEYISNSMDNLRWGLESVKITTDSYQQLLALTCAKEIFVDKETKMDPKFDFLLLQRFCCGFEKISHHEDTKELLRKVDLFRKHVRAAGLHVSDLRRFERYGKTNLVFLVLKLVVLSALVT